MRRKWHTGTIDHGADAFHRQLAKDRLPAVPIDINEQTIPSGRNVRLDTLVRLRWLAVIGQTTAVLVVYFGLDFELPIWACLAIIALAAWLNVALRVRFRLSQRLEPDRAAWLLAFDIAEVAILLFLTGGLQNPFSFLLLGPVLLSATALPPRMTVILGGNAVADSSTGPSSRNENGFCRPPVRNSRIATSAMSKAKSQAARSGSSR